MDPQAAVMPKLRPAHAPPAPPKDLTPDVVVQHGWRDEEYPGDDQCPRCRGWGAMENDRREGRRTFRTCAKCLGTGRVRG